MKIAIDLLPQEFRIEEIKRARFYKIQAVGVVVIILVVFLTSITISLRFLQSQNITAVQTKLSGVEKRVQELNNIQASLLLLKDRLKVINKYLETPSEEVQAYQLISQLVPPSVSINSVSIDRGKEIFVLATAANATALDELTGRLISGKTSQDKVKQVSIESLSRSKDESIRLNFKVKLK